MQAYYEVLSLKKCYGAAVNKCGTHVYTREPNDEANDAKVLNSKNAPRAVMLYGLLIMSVYLCGMHIYMWKAVLGNRSNEGELLWPTSKLLSSSSFYHSKLALLPALQPTL